MDHSNPEERDAIKRSLANESAALDEKIDELDDRSWDGEYRTTIAEGYALHRRAGGIYKKLVSAGMTLDMWLVLEEMERPLTEEDYAVRDILSDMSFCDNEPDNPADWPEPCDEWGGNAMPWSAVEDL